MRLAASFLFFVFVALCGACAGRNVHLVEGSSMSAAPVSRQAMEERIAAAAIEYREIGPVQRVALMDIAHPADAAEFAALHGHGVMLLVAFSHDATELPPKAVSLRTSTGSIPLTLLTFLRTESAQETARVLGQHRWDALYLYPSFLQRDAMSVLMDFAKNRDGFVVTEFDDESRHMLVGADINAIVKSRPPNEAVVEFVRREFPGFLDRRDDYHR